MGLANCRPQVCERADELPGLEGSVALADGHLVEHPGFFQPATASFAACTLRPMRDAAP